MRRIIPLLFLLICCTPVFVSAQLSKWCGTMEGAEQRVQNDAEYAAFRQAAIDMPKSSANSIPCDGTNSVVIPVAFHFDASFTCADPTCLLTKVQEQIDALNIAYGDNSAIQQNIDLNAVCPAGYPLTDVSTGTCIEFKLAVPPAGQGLDPTCDPAITIGQFSGGTQTDFNGAGAAWAGYFNIFVVEEVVVTIFGFPIPGIIGIADGIPGMANGDGITILADAFGGVGAGCNSGNDLDVGATDGTGFFFTEGGTTAHEVGHYLGLYHIWGDDQPLIPGTGTPPFCTGDDGTMPQVGPFVVNDTPLQSEATPTNAPCPTLAGATCATLPATCDGTNDYFHNYMDYSNDICYSMFTDDQSMVVNYWANQLFGGSTIPTFDAAPAVLTTLCEMQPCNVQVVCPVTTSIDTPVDACSTDGTQTICLTFDIDPTGLVDISINGDPQAPLIDPVALTACVDVALPTNQTCNTVPLDFVLSATCTEDGSNIVDAAGADINGSIGTIVVFPEPLTVSTSGDGACTDLTAQLLSADNTECAVSSVACDSDGTSLSFDFSADVTFAPSANCPLPTLTGSLTCDGCVSCTSVAGTLTTSDNLTVCALDGNADIITVSTTGEAGSNSGWLITDATGAILSGTTGTGSAGVVNLGGTTFAPDLEGAPPGSCSIWLITWDGTLSGADMGDNASGITSDICFELSNPITVDRLEVNAGTISTTDVTTVCALDGNADIINATLSGQTATNFGWLITDGATGDILSMGVMAAGSTTFSPDLEGAPVGTCQIWSISWEGTLSGANQGDNAAGITSDICFGLSNPIDVIRQDCTCEEEIFYMVSSPCDMTGATIELADGVGTVIATMPLGANGGTGSFGVQDCASYSIIINNAPACYTDEGGEIGPRTFTTDGNGSTTQAFMTTPENVPTVGEWGLIILALMMSITAVVGIRQRKEAINMQ